MHFFKYLVSSKVWAWSFVYIIKRFHHGKSILDFKRDQEKSELFQRRSFWIFYDDNVCCRLILEADDQAIHHWTYEKTPYCMQRISFYWKLNSPFLADLFFFPLGSGVGVTKYNIAAAAACVYITFSRNLINQASTMLYLCMTFMLWGNCSCGIPILVLFLSQIYQN